MPKGWLLTPEPYEAVKVLLPRGIDVDSYVQYGGAVRYDIVGKQIEEGKGYHLVSTDGPLLRCVELVENDFEPDPALSGQDRQPVRPVVDV